MIKMKPVEHKCPACNNTTNSILVAEGITAFYCPFCSNKINMDEIRH